MPLPKFEHHDARHEPTLIEPARSQMTASSPRGTFSQAELTAERVITRYITHSGARWISADLDANTVLDGSNRPDDSARAGQRPRYGLDHRV